MWGTSSPDDKLTGDLRNVIEFAMIERDQRIVKSTTEAREGVTGHNVRYVLIVSVVGVILVFGAVWLYFFT
jgi:hypothetical protein